MKLRSSRPLVAGVDEVGRGPLAGPVVAAAVILDPLADLSDIMIDDSKRLSAKKRARAEAVLRQRALAWTIGIADVAEIDRLNIHHASLLAMRRAILCLPLRPAHVLVDGKHLPRCDVPATAIVGGDYLEPSISAASIIAKEYRDRYMSRLDREFPGYAFARNKGYPTREHILALSTLGVCAVHRRTFAPVSEILHPSA